MEKMGVPGCFLPLCPPTPGAFRKDRTPQRLVVARPYRYVRIPLYAIDVDILIGTTPLCGNRWLAILTAE